MTQTLGNVLLSGLLAYLSYFVAVSLMTVRRAANKSLLDFYQMKEGSAQRGEAIGNAVLSHLPFSLEEWEDHLRWAQRGGKYQDYTIARLVFTALTYAGVGLVVPLTNPAPVAFLVPIGAAVYPFIAVRSKANTVRKRVMRLLPETAALISAELAAGNSPEKAVERAAEMPGALAGLLPEALNEARSSGRPLFSRRPVTGALVETFRKAKLPALTAFASQLDMVAGKGVSGAELMAQIAETLVGEYRARLASEVEKLDGRLTLLVMLFFFAPFVILLLATFLLPVAQAFGS
jgi:Flp pilus assembly protein TadB